MSRNNSIVIAIVSIGVILALLIVNLEPLTVSEPHDENNGHSENKHQFERGPHGGKLLHQENFELEITIFEDGVPPQFRIYAYQDEQPIKPENIDLKITLQRFGGKIETVRFEAEQDFLLGDIEITEPHSFLVKIDASFEGKNYSFNYEQVEGRVKLSERAQQQAGLEILTAAPADIEQTLQLPGEIEFNQNRIAHVVPRIKGIVTEVRINLGAKVERGEILAVLESRELAELKSQYQVAQKRLKLARSLYQREAKLWRDRISPEQDYLNAKTQLAEAEIMQMKAKALLDALGISANDKSSDRHLTRYQILAPLSGTIVEKHLVVGEAVQAETTILIIADLSTVWGDFKVPVNVLPHVHEGQRVRVKAPEQSLVADAEIHYLGALVGEQTRAAPAHVHLDNPQLKWRPGLFVTMEIIAETKTAPVAVAQTALQTWRDLEVVFVKVADEFEVRPLQLGRRDERFVEVITGLQAGEHYAAGNSFVLKAELGKAGATHDH